MTIRRRGSKPAQQGAAKVGTEVKAEAVSRSRQQTRGPKSGARQDANAVPAIPERLVIAAVESLYADELKPVGRILRKRIAELRPTSATKTHDPTIEQLRSLCSASTSFTVELEEGGDFFAFLTGWEHNFVDIYDTCDTYPSELWSELRTYCESPSGQEMSLPGGRYACAQALLSYSLPCLRGCSLGRICHIVQLAIAQQKILGYLNGAVVAYSKSQSKLKERLASTGHAAESGDTHVKTLPVASLDAAQACMQRILQENSGEVPLSNVKHYFRSTCQFELSETSLGFSRLSELLRGPLFQGVCTVELRDAGYVVIEAAEACGSMCPVDSMQSSGSSTVDTSGWSGSDVPSSSTSSVVGSDPELSDADQDEHESFCDEPLVFEDAGIVMDSQSTDAPAAPAMVWNPITPGTLAKEGFVVHNTFFDVAPTLPTPVRTGAARRAKSLPKEVGRLSADSQNKSEAHDLKTAQMEPCHAIQKTPVMLSPSLASPAIFWPPSPAWDNDAQNAFVWNMPLMQHAAYEPSASVLGSNNFPHFAAPLAPLGHVLLLEQCI